MCMYMFSQTFFYVAVSASFHIYVVSKLKADETSFVWSKIWFPWKSGTENLAGSIT